MSDLPQPFIVEAEQLGARRDQEREAANAVHAYASWLRALADAAPEFMRVATWFRNASDLIVAQHVELRERQKEARALRRELCALRAAYRSALASAPDKGIPFMGRNSASG